MMNNDMLRKALEMAVRQNNNDMIMTGDELRQCMKALATSATPERSGKLADERGETPRDHDVILASRLLEAVETICGQSGEEVGRMVDWLTNDSGLFKCMSAYYVKASPATEADSSSAAPSETRAFEFSHKGESIAFDGYEEWTLPATYKRLAPVAMELARRLHSAPAPTRGSLSAGERGGVNYIMDAVEHYAEHKDKSTKNRIHGMLLRDAIKIRDLATPRQTEEGGLNAAKAAMERAKKLPIWDNMHHPLHVELDVIFKYLDASTSAPKEPAAQGGVPEGWKLVPVEPTQEMFAAARTSASGSHTEKLLMASYWRNMLAAAPTGASK